MNPARATAADPDVLDCLLDVLDPELGLNVVDLGLVYRASRTGDAIQVAMTLTTRACPLGGLIVEEAREHLQRRFRDAPSIDVSLVWDPPWSPNLITERGRELLGHSPRSEI